MSSSNERPGKCRECAKSKASGLHGRCRLCKDLEFQESVLCELNRSIQDDPGFECHAFQPILKLMSPSKNGVPEMNHGPIRDGKKNGFQERLRSDKIKYKRALALQRLERDPDGVYVQLKHHFTWNVSLRRSVFLPSNDFFDFANDTFLRCSQMIGGFATLLYLAPDHIHVYVESDGELSIEEMVERMKTSSNKALIEKFPFLRDKLGGHPEIWDAAYFVETVG